MALDSRPLPNSPTPNNPTAASQDTHPPDVIATPEGDGEFDPNQPLHPLPDGALDDPEGAEPLSYKRDHK